MKVNPTIYLLCGLYFLLQSSNFSQNTNYLFDFGAILTDVKWRNNAYSNRNRDIKPNFSFSIGGRISHKVDEMISLSLGLSYKNISFVEEFSPIVPTQINANSIDNTRGENRYSLHSLSLPITVGYSPFSTYFPKLFTGIEFGFFVNGFEKQDYISNVCFSCWVGAIPKPLGKRYFDNETELFQSKEELS